MTEKNDNPNESTIPITLKSNVQIEGLKDDGGGKDTKNILQKNKNLTRTMVVKKNIEDYSLDDLGKIENAKKHRSANRPLHKINDFTECVNFCRCCNLPCEEKGIIEPFGCCEDIDKFSECGLGVTLYFYFFRFITFIVFMGVFVLSISMIVFNLNYTDGITDVCDSYFKGIHDIKSLEYCEGFIKHSEENTNLYERFNRWILRLSTDNFLVYRKLPQQLKSRNLDNVNDVVINYSILNFCYLISVFIINIYFIIFIKGQAQKARLLNFSIRDYTVLISDAKQILFDYVDRQKQINPNLMRGSQIAVENGRDFKTYVNDYIKADKQLSDIKINNINLCYDLGNYIDFRDEYEVCKRQIFQVEHNPYNIDINTQKGLFGDDRLYYDFILYKIGIYRCHCLYNDGKPLVTLKKNKIDLEKDLEQEQRNCEFVTEHNFTGYMFISFDKIKDKELFLSHYPHNFFDMILYFLKNIKYYLFCCFISHDDIIRFRRAKGIDAYDPPEPEDIIWENFNYSERKRAIRTIIVFLVCIGIMIISWGIVFGLTFVQDILYQRDKVQGNKNIFLKYLVSLAITIAISIINAIFQLVLEYITHYEKQISRSNYILSLSIKISIFTFLNSAIIPLISKHLVLIIKEDDNGYTNNPKYNRRRERNNLIIDDMLIYFIVNAIITPLLWTINIPYLIKRIQQCCIERGKDPDKNHYMTQRDLNELYLYPDMNLAYKYSYLIKTTAMCLFYLPIFPLGFIFACVGFIFAYFLEKFNFTHLYRRPEMLDEIITKVYADYFIIIIFIGGIGDFIFLGSDRVYDDNKWALLNIILFGVLIIIPYTKFFNCNFVGIDKSEYLNCPLSEVYFTFYNDYQRQNPLTKRIGYLNYLYELKKYEYLSEYAYKIAQENIEQLNLMEIYYGISRGNIPLSHQSVIANANNASVLSTGNLVKSILGRGLLKNTIIRPEKEDNPEVKKQKKKFFESQIFNMFGKSILNKGMKGESGNIESINELNESEENDVDTKDQLVDAYNNPLAINMGLGPLPLTTSIYKDEQQENKSDKNLNANS